VADPAPAPAAGSCAAIVAALAAALGAMAARASGIEGAEKRCRALLEEVGPLARADSEAYSAVLRAAGADERRAALGRASDVPLAVGEAARATAELAADLSSKGDPRLRGEAVAAVILGEAAARVAALLVAMNLESESDPRVRRAREHAAAAGSAARRASKSR
jgi:formiminotetrahydrofolate cyclodeaminase